MIDYISKRVNLSFSFDDLELLQTNMIENDNEALREQISLLFGIKYEKPIDEPNGASQVDA